MYASENRDVLPTMNYVDPADGLTKTGSWLWDLPGVTKTNMLLSGATRNVFYCPSYADKNTDPYWNQTWVGSPPAPYASLGYGFATQGADALTGTPAASGYVLPKTTSKVSVPGGPPTFTATQLGVTDSFFVFDATISTGTSPNYSFTGISGVAGATGSEKAPHLDGNKPVGGNETALDGHVEFRKFALMAIHATGSGSVPSFWW